MRPENVKVPNTSFRVLASN